MRSPSQNGRQARKDRLIHERVHDPYKARLKLSEPTVCPACGAVYRQGRWQWTEFRPDDADREACQACRRIRDRCPAGVVTLSGGFVQRHRDDLLGLVRHHEQVETREHPLHRIIGVEERSDAIVINTTDIHMPRRIGEALRSAYKGELNFKYEEENYFIRVGWRRDT
jgi:ferredoxin